VVEIEEENILESPSIGHVDTEQNRYVYAIGKVDDAVKLLLDPDKLLNDDDLSVIEQAQENEETEGE
jgi:purine-binding chemotaxis protein CheW